MHTRVTVHTLATATGALVVFRAWSGDPLAALAWYAGGFIGFHVAMFPFCSLWMVTVGGMQRWVKNIVEEELIRYDMVTYDKQLQRLLPPGGSPGSRGQAPGANDERP
jgi:hypothetical protein